MLRANLDADESELVSHMEVLEAAFRGGVLATTFVRALVKEM